MKYKKLVDNIHFWFGKTSLRIFRSSLLSTNNVVIVSSKLFLLIFSFAKEIDSGSISVARNFHEYILAPNNGYIHEAPVPLIKYIIF